MIQKNEFCAGWQILDVYAVITNCSSVLNAIVLQFLVMFSYGDDSSDCSLVFFVLMPILNHVVLVGGPGRSSSSQYKGIQVSGSPSNACWQQLCGLVRSRVARMRTAGNSVKTAHSAWPATSCCPEAQERDA